MQQRIVQRVKQPSLANGAVEDPKVEGGVQMDVVDGCDGGEGMMTRQMAL